MVLVKTILDSALEHADLVSKYKDPLFRALEGKKRISPSRSETTSAKPVFKSPVMFKPQMSSLPDCSEGRDLGTTLASEGKKGKIVERAVIEITPGFRQPLRLALETEAAMRKGFVRESRCQLCKLTMLCIRDARFVLCPICRSIAPLSDDEEEILVQSNKTFGVGLGVLKRTKSPLRQRAPPMA